MLEIKKRSLIPQIIITKKQYAFISNHLSDVSSGLAIIVLFSAAMQENLGIVGNARLLSFVFFLWYTGVNFIKRS